MKDSDDKFRRDHWTRILNNTVYIYYPLDLEVQFQWCSFVDVRNTYIIASGEKAYTSYSDAVI